MEYAVQRNTGMERAYGVEQVIYIFNKISTK